MQQLNPELATNHVVSLTEILSCRELRQSRQQLWLTTHHSTLISLTLVAPGPVKDTVLTRQIFNLASQALQALFTRENWQILAAETFAQPSGTEALIALNLPAERVKQKMVWLEQNHAVGRLWDIDVIDENGKILSRADSGLASRTCLICNNDARICGRNQSHSFEELTQAMAKLVENELNSTANTPHINKV